jgi:FHA domain
MRAFLEIWSAAGPALVPLDEDRVTLGRGTHNDVCLADDPQVSRLHALLECFAAGWSVRDLGSVNGTFVNGERLLAEHRLEDGDELRVGETRLVFRNLEREESDETLSASEEVPRMTGREHDTLVALCRPILGADSFAQPATIKEMAAELVVSEAAIKFHLSSLYDKFGIYQTGLSRRALLANEAIRRGGVTVAELRRQESRDQRHG